VGSRDSFDLCFKQRLADITGLDLNDQPELQLPNPLSHYDAPARIGGMAQAWTPRGSGDCWRSGDYGAWWAMDATRPLCAGEGVEPLKPIVETTPAAHIAAIVSARMRRGVSQPR
jgi:hypothetical protein